jgi:hypothetical protein
MLLKTLRDEVLDYLARMACHTLAIAIAINAQSSRRARELHDKHFLRRHGRHSYNRKVGTQ